MQAWRSCRKKDPDKLESIQSRATKMIPEPRDLSYESRLRKYGLATLDTGRLRYDQIEVFLKLNDYEDIDRNMFFILKGGSRTRGHESALVFKLSTDCVTASSVNMFKNKVDTYLRRAGYK